MRIAYLLLVFNDPDHFGRLVNSLRSRSAEFFVHVDGRVDLSVFTKRVPPSTVVHFVTGSERVPVYWGGYSQMRATLALMRAAASQGRRFDRLCLLSNADYPIKSVEQIEDRLHSDHEFMRVDSRIDFEAGGSHVKHVNRFHLADIGFLSHKHRGRIGRVVDGAIGRIPRTPLRSLSLYHGSQWWVLSSDCVSYVTGFLDDHPELERYFRYTTLAGEILFQSIIKASPFAERLVHDFERAGTAALPPNEHGAHYIDWSGPSSSSPKELDSADFAPVIASQALFARKFVKGRSAGLLAMLDALGGRAELSSEDARPV